MRAADDVAYIRSKMSDYRLKVDYGTFGKALHIAIVCQLHSDSVQPVAYPYNLSGVSFDLVGDPEC